MNMRHVKKFAASGLLFGVITLMTGPASAIDYWLCAGIATKTIPIQPDTHDEVTVWGFALSSPNFSDNCGNDVEVPGPALTVPYNDPNLTIHVRNLLPEPVSIVIPGQITPMNPHYFPLDNQGRRRVRSFTHETAPTTDGIYFWNNLKPGTYAYHSGTHPQIQVQMGLYGSMVKNFEAGQAYPGVPYDNEITLLYSEIDPALHQAVANGTYGPPGPGIAVTSTIGYKPRYFLVNGAPYLAGDENNPIPAGSVGQRTLLRLINMGLKTHAPMLQGMHLKVIAEDGNLYPYPREQYSVMLPAAKTQDAILVSESEGIFPFYDRMLALTNGANAQGGLMNFLQVGASTSTLTAMADGYGTPEDTPLAVAAADGVLANDSQAGVTAVLVNAPAFGTLALNGDGSFVYTPNANFNGTDGFSYKMSDGSAYSNVAPVSLTVTAVNDVPTAANDTYETNQEEALNITAPGVLGNDSDVEGSSLTAAVASGVTHGALNLSTDGSFVYMPELGYSGSDSFTYVANDGSVNSSPATVNITVNTVAANTAPVAADDNASTTKNTSVNIPVLANDTDAENNIDPASVRIAIQPSKGGNLYVDLVTGVIRYTPKLNFRGTDIFKYTVKDTANAESNEAKVRVNVK